MRGTTLLLWLIIAIASARAFNHGSVAKAGRNSNILSTSIVDDERRREILGTLIASVIAIEPLQVGAEKDQQSNSRQEINNGNDDTHLRDYYNPLLPKWRGSSLPGPLSLSEAYSSVCANGSTEPVLSMGRWPDPILRHTSSPIPSSVFNNEGQLEKLRLVARALKNTAREEGAVGLAAQQCGVDASLIFIDGVVKSAGSIGGQKVDDRGRGSNILAEAAHGVFGQSSWRKSQKEVTGEGAIDDTLFKFYKGISDKKQSLQQDKGIFLVNPRIIQRSPESEMLVWTEECLVLPPEFRATLLRDAVITIEYESLGMNDDCSSCGMTEQITLHGELARCAQHEMDHDRGILIVDHVSLDELLSIDGNTFMAEIENADGLHQRRMHQAYSRYLSASTLIPEEQILAPLAMQNHSGYHSKVKRVEHRPWFVQSAHAIDAEAPQLLQSESLKEIQNSRSLEQSEGTKANSVPDCDSKCLEERKRVIEQRRAMMQQSRTNTRRGDVLELSRQRANMYGTEFQGLKPEYCSQPGYCP